ncbi:hypothetical protein AB1286_28755 [Trinickia sp. NRRL B-1857]|uniref:hypothetical protein n=1 Tax=Trinickia sp. NRRL B-1857 TaxID=3162879 RepID=UPI003D2683E7
MGTSDQIVVCSTFPDDIQGKYGAQGASLREAGEFAWQEFIALNWPALANKRDTPDDSKKFGDTSLSGPLVWHTFRGKVEIYPGLYQPERNPPTDNPPPGYVDSAAKDYGYDAGPAYCYDRPGSGVSASAPKSCALDTNPPWINLDENSQIFLDQMFAGVVSQNNKLYDDQVLFMAKANRVEYKYIAGNHWWDGTAPLKATSNYIKANNTLPPPGSSQYVSFPAGAVEVKAAWRRLSPTEDPSRYYMTKVRYYVHDAAGKIESVDTEMALVGLHIIHKTETAPYFIYATFEQADNIIKRDGSFAEDVDGAEINPPDTFFAPEIASINSTSGTTPQQFSFGNFSNVTRNQLYYLNTPYTGIPVKHFFNSHLQESEKILVNKRKHRIPDDIVSVNKLAHAAIDAYTNDKFGKMAPRSPWKYYKLVNVQSKPIAGKVASVDYQASDAATYYQANSVIETDYNLQDFSGRFFAEFKTTDPHKFTITDYAGAVSGSKKSATEFNNVLYKNLVSNQIASVNMGGCMGCHGNVELRGADFSFILAGGRVHLPDVSGEPVTSEQVARFVKYFGAHQ